MKILIDVNLAMKGDKAFLANLFQDIHSRDDLKLVIGGTKYRLELSRYPALLRQINQFGKAGRSVKVDVRDDNLVDEYADRIEAIVIDKIGHCPAECDDFHILALCVDSGCRCVFTGDVRMKHCIDCIRPQVGHRHCPDLKFVRSKNDFERLRRDRYRA